MLYWKQSPDKDLELIGSCLPSSEDQVKTKMQRIRLVAERLQGGMLTEYILTKEDGPVFESFSATRNLRGTRMDNTEFN
jgi:hypothetical protein